MSRDMEARRKRQSGKLLSMGLALLVSLSAMAGAGWLYAESKNHQAARGNAIDIGFAQFMSLHHEQAIAMAQLLLDGRPTGIRQLAQNIAYAQLQELGKMQGWLMLWDQPLKPTTRSMSWMLAGNRTPSARLKQYLIDCEASPTGMPGLATLAELETLRRLQGVERDRYFLTLMLAHHQGGIPMAELAAEQARTEAVRRLAAQITLDQTQEVMHIRRIQAAIENQPDMTLPSPGQG